MLEQKTNSLIEPTIKVLIIEDDDVTALNLSLSLEAFGYEVISLANNTFSALYKLKIYTPDIVLIDITLGYINEGIEIGRFIRKNTFSCPFIYITANSENDTLSSAKETEPYGYIVKPFDPITLHATIQMALYHFEEEQKLLIEINELHDKTQHLKDLLYGKEISTLTSVKFGGNYFYDISAGETYYNDKKINLTKKENDFISLLIAQAGTVVEFAQASNYVWNKKGATDNSIRTLVWRLRNKLPTDVIKNSSGSGYYLEN